MADHQQRAEYEGHFMVSLHSIYVHHQSINVLDTHLLQTLGTEVHHSLVFFNLILELTFYGRNINWNFVLTQLQHEANSAIG